MQMVLHQPLDFRRENTLQHLATQAWMIMTGNRLSHIVKQGGSMEFGIGTGAFRQLVDLE